KNNIKKDKKIPLASIDADSLAQEIENPKAVNLIVLGFALAKGEKAAGRKNKLFCSGADIKDVLEHRFGKNQKMLSASLKALDTGYNAKDK
ncbi:MAG: 2-oxoacid:acceptor oxidoreductase family protein, partial [Deltaproteobacteria bacterium]|nr:2-oxoacid:acceptor oxidoreductase family protein [Deltaproteobacteria bacterium]